ncbi:dipeptidase [soil metagenome]
MFIFNNLSKYIILLFFTVFILSCHRNIETGRTSDQDQELYQKAVEIAHNTLITDGHIDLPYRLSNKMEDVSQRTESGEFDYVRAKEGGLDAPFMSIYIPSEYEEKGGGMALADSLMEMVRSIAQNNPDKFALAVSPEEILENFKEGLISLPMGLENGTPINGKLENIDYLYEQGIRYITLTHGKDNHICDSSYDTTRTWNGLSPFGREVVKKMNETGIMVDVSHISDDAFYQVMELSTVPVIASHSSCRHFTPGFERNMSDEMIRLLAEKNGVIQINFGSNFLDSASREQSAANNTVIEMYIKEQNLASDSPEAQRYAEEVRILNPVYSDVTVVADHIDHVVKLVGVNFVGLGSDFDGVGDTLPEGLKDVSDYPNLIFELLKRGYSEADIRKICHENVFRVWNEVEKGRN